MIHEIVIPVMDQTTEQVTLVRWLAQEGAPIQRGTVLCEIESEKATVEIEASASGILHKTLIAEGAVIPPLTVIALIGEATDTPPEIDPFYRTSRAHAPEAKPTVPEIPQVASRRNRLVVSPRARKLAEEHGIDLATIEPTGPDNRIIEEDVQAAIQRIKTSTVSVTPERIAQAKAERVAESWRAIPHFYTSITIDLSTVAARKTGDLTYTDFFAFAIAETLKQHPALNGHWKDGRHSISSAIHLGLVVQTERGLIIPTLCDLQNLTLEAIAAERVRLVEQAHAGKLSAAAMTEATFTLSNMGAGHIDQFTAIISPPQVAILSVGSVQPRPLVVGDELVIRPTATFTLGADHRAIDGRQSAAFLEQLKVILEYA